MPDTGAYMIAGFAVILGGIIVYVTTIFVRNAHVARQADVLNSRYENLSKESHDS